MTRQPLPGIDGVLSNLLSTGRAHSESIASNEPTPADHPRASATAESGLSRTTGARRGRPLGPHCREAGPKEKVTFRISCELATEYRNWSWEARCSLSTLVERALGEYYRRQPGLGSLQSSESDI